MTTMRITRFSLRALLIVTAVLCFVWGYGANRRHRQRQFVAEQMRTFTSDSMEPIFLNKLNLRPWAHTPLYLFRKQAPNALKWIAGSLYSSVAVVIPARDVTARVGKALDERQVEREYFWITNAQADYRNARQLFPDAAVYAF